jgi:deoxyribose-phosphate aldolase
LVKANTLNTVLAESLDLTLLNPLATPADIEMLVETSLKHNVYAVCVNSNNVSYALKFIGGRSLKVASVVGFPSGAHILSAKIAEAEAALAEGAAELDMVADLANIKMGNWDAFAEEVVSLKHVTNYFSDSLLKVILETALLTDEEIFTASKIASNAGADFVKTSTGYAKEGGASIHAVKIMLEAVNGKSQVKASGGIRTHRQALEYLELGVTRIGASSISILNPDYDNSPSLDSSDKY